MDGDGLKDIKIINAFFDYETGLILTDMPKIERVFMQMNDGLFYSSSFDKGDR